MSWFGIIRTGESEMNKSQKEFEKFANHWRYELTQNEEGFYDNALTQRAWDSWCASRANLVVELPVTVCRTHVYEVPFTNEVGMEHDEYFEVDEIKMALDSAGVKYK